jgi:hypothetical protein
MKTLTRMLLALALAATPACAGWRCMAQPTLDRSDPKNPVYGFKVKCYSP